MKKYLSIISLIIANIYPLLGVIFWGWDISNLLMIYWIETLIVGFFTIIKMQHSKYVRLDNKTKPEENKLYTKIEGDKFKGLATPYMKKVCIWIFVGIYCFTAFVHLMFLISMLFNRNTFGLLINGFFPSLEKYSQFEAFHLDIGALILPVFLLFLSHGVSFIVNFIGKQEAETIAINDQLGAPFERVYIMQFAIVFGSFFLEFINFSLAAPIILLIAKTWFDVKFHGKQHEKMSFMFPGSNPRAIQAIPVTNK